MNNELNLENFKNGEILRDIIVQMSIFFITNNIFQIHHLFFRTNKQSYNNASVISSGACLIATLKISEIGKEKCGCLYTERLRTSLGMGHVRATCRVGSLR